MTRKLGCHYYFVCDAAIPPPQRWSYHVQEESSTFIATGSASSIKVQWFRRTIWLRVLPSHKGPASHTQCQDKTPFNKKEQRREAYRTIDCWFFGWPDTQLSIASHPKMRTEFWIGWGCCCCCASKWGPVGVAQDDVGFFDRSLITGHRARPLFVCLNGRYKRFFGLPFRQPTPPLSIPKRFFFSSVRRSMAIHFEFLFRVSSASERIITRFFFGPFLFTHIKITHGSGDSNVLRCREERLSHYVRLWYHITKRILCSVHPHRERGDLRSGEGSERVNTRSCENANTVGTARDSWDNFRVESVDAYYQLWTYYVFNTQGSEKVMPRVTTCIEMTGTVSTIESCTVFRNDASVS